MIKTLGNAVVETSGTGFRMLLVIGVAWMMLLTYDQALDYCLHHIGSR